jgi:multidrug efflux system outer membrane protein
VAARLNVLLLAALLLPACFRASPQSAARALRLLESQPRAAGAARSLDREQAVRLAVAQSPELLAARTAEAEAAGEARDTTLENPTLRLRDVELDKAADGTPELQLGLRVPIPQPLLLSAEAQRGRLRAEEAQAERSDLERRTRAEVKKLFARLALVEQAARRLKEILPLLARYRTLAAERVREGASTELDATLPLLRLAEAEDQRAALALERVRIERRLRTLTGVSGRTGFAVAASDLETAPVRQLEAAALVRHALARRQDLRRAAARVGVAEADTYLLRVRRWPWLRYLEVSYHVTPVLDPRRFELALAVELPIFNWRRGELSAREARLEGRRLEERARVLEAARDVSDACERVRLSAARLAELGRSLLPALEAGARAASKAVEDGALDPVRASVALFRKLRAERRYLEAQLAAREAGIDLEAAVGGALP